MNVPEDILEPNDASGESLFRAPTPQDDVQPDRSTSELNEADLQDDAVFDADEVPVDDSDAVAEDADAAAATPEQEQAPGAVTEEEVRAKLQGLDGRWYVLHTYSGYEKRVKQDLEVRMHSMNMEDYIFQIEVPMEEVFEIRRGQRKLVSRVRMPGYVLIRMDMTDDSWRVVQNTNGVTGFVGNGRTPVPLSEDEVVKMLTPVIEAEAAAEAKAEGRPTGTAPATVSPYEVGDAVILTSEPWAGMPATVSDVDAANQRLTVLMTLVGQETPVELSFSQVRRED
ncbi:MAG: transcription termination/antitermination factor NusG [Actinomycetaceae bacterium]|jgi:transcriptional antiterminator NusG|nr:transcription termination/antitermination factor NusG [Actinomycetaceae bacterium]